MPAPSPFDYAIIRVVPRVERGECLNAGVILYCRTRRFLAAALDLDPARLAALDLSADAAEIQAHLDSLAHIAAGGPDSGPIGRLPQSERFHWLTAPRSTIIQPSPVHPGRCLDPAAALAHLLATLVQRPA
ncbi:MAG: DUF3037 domain-containing protein [Chloroflexota bacterium]|nr:DUF3037 domain-containing protein [Chloroflexota bacterium]